MKHPYFGWNFHPISQSLVISLFEQTIVVKINFLVSHKVGLELYEALDQQPLETFV